VGGGGGGLGGGEGGGGGGLLARRTEIDAFSPGLDQEEGEGSVQSLKKVAMVRGEWG